MQEVATGMREKGINIEWINREEWRRKTKLQAQKDVKRFILKTNSLKSAFNRNIDI